MLFKIYGFRNVCVYSEVNGKKWAIHAETKRNMLCYGAEIIWHKKKPLINNDFLINMNRTINQIVILTIIYLKIMV